MRCDVIVIDDDAEFADSLVELLEEEGYQATAFGTPEAAFEWLLAGNRTSVVLLDLHTPGMSAQRFRALMISAPEVRDIPLMMVSGDPRVRAVATAVGAAGAFQKPIDVENLIRRLEVFATERTAADTLSSP